MKISNITGKNGQAVKNQFVVENEGIIYFQSYESIIAKKHKGQITLDAHTWDYSMTTGKYRNIFLGEDKKTTEKKIKDGIYKLDNLNE